MNKGVRCIVINKDKILLVKREDNGLWELPGGRIEKKETEIQAAIRELKEETGLQAKETLLIGKWINDSWIYKGKAALVYIKKVKGDWDNLLPSWESPEVKYWNKKDINKSPKYLKNLINNILRNYKHHPLRHRTTFKEYGLETILKFIYGKIKKILRGHLMVGS